ncbi:MAG: hypothetical protein NVSMB57_05240 [Actinomycetota bacterium]
MAGITIALSVLSLVGAACGKSTDSGTTTESPGNGGRSSLASTFVFGAPPDCATNKFCAQGLESVYGIKFKELKSLDFGGPATVAALKSGAVQVGELFSTSVYDPTFVVLDDDKHLEAADNIAPVIRNGALNTATRSLINSLAPKLTTKIMLDLNKQADLSHKDPAALAKAFLKSVGLSGGKKGLGAGKTIKVGVSGAFSESKIVAEMYAQILEANGFTVKRQLGLQNRKVSDAALFSGQIDLKPEYLASEALSLNPKAAASGDAEKTSTVLSQLLASKKVSVLAYAPAIDTNVFVVSRKTAAKFGLTKVSDLAKPIKAA